MRSLADAVPVLARRHAVVVASPADPALRALATTPPADAEGLARVVAAADVQDARAAAAARVRAAGAAVVDAPPGMLARACVAAYLRAKSGRWCSPVRARRPTNPQNRRQPEPERRLRPHRQLRPGGQPLEEAAEHEPRRRPQRQLDALRGLGLQRPQPRPRAGHEQRVPEPQARDAADDDAGDLERPVRGDQPHERLAVARAEGEPADDAEQQAVEAERGDRPQAVEQPAHEGDQRDLDVVDQHLRGEDAALAGAEVAPRRRRVRGAGEVPGDEADGGARVGERPRARRPPRARAGAPRPAPAGRAAPRAAASSRAG